MNIKKFLFKNTNIRQTVAKNTFWLGVNQVGGRFIRAFLFIYAARVLGVSNYGLFSYAIGIVGLFFVLSDLGGLTSVLMVESARNPDDRQKYISTSLLIKIVLLAISFIFLIVVAPLVSKFSGVMTLLIILAIASIFDQLKEFLFAIPRSLEKMEIETVFNFVYNIVLVITGFVVLKQYPDVFYFSLVYAVVSVVGLIFLLWYLREYLRGITKNISASLIKPILKYTLPLGVASIFSALALHFDNLLLGFFKTSSEIGFYNAAQKPGLIIVILPSLLAASIFPLLSRLTDDRKKFRKVIEQIFGLIFLMVLPITFGGFILAKETMVFLYGVQYIPAATIFKITLAGLIFASPIVILNNSLFVFGKQKSLLAAGIISGISSTVLNLILIPRYGNIGAATASLISILLVSAWLNWKFYSIIPYNILSQLGRASIAVIVMSILVLIFKYWEWPFLPNVVLGAAIYLLVLYLLKEPWLFRKEWQKILS